MENVALDGELLKDAAAYVSRWIAYRQFTQWVPGVVFALAHDGRKLAEGAAGAANLETDEPMTVEHRFRIASHSKMYTAVAVMRLVEDGRLRLDDTAGTYVDGLADDVAHVTLRELLSHGAGVVRDGDDAGFWEGGRDFPGPADLAAMLAGPRVVPRNTRFKYSNVGYALLGRVIESVTGASYSSHLAAAVLQPLGLADTTPDLTDEVADRMASGHSSSRGRQDRRVLPGMPARAYAPAAGVCSTARDLVRFGGALCYGVDGVLGEESKRELLHVQWQQPEDKAQHYGLGFAAHDVGDRRVFGHGGGYTGYITATRFDPVDRLVVVVLTNAIDGPAAEWATGVVKLVDLAQRVGAEPGGVEADRADAFVGRFRGLWTTIDLVRFGRHLVAIDPEQPDPTNGMIRLDPADDGYVIGECPGASSYGEPVSLTDDGALRWAGHVLPRVD